MCCNVGGWRNQTGFAGAVLNLAQVWLTFFNRGQDALAPERDSRAQRTEGLRPRSKGSRPTWAELRNALARWTHRPCCGTIEPVYSLLSEVEMPQLTASAIDIEPHLPLNRRAWAPRPRQPAGRAGGHRRHHRLWIHARPAAQALGRLGGDAPGVLSGASGHRRTGHEHRVGGRASLPCMPFSSPS